MCTVEHLQKYKNYKHKKARHKMPERKKKKMQLCKKKLHCVKEWEAKTGHFYFSGAGHHKTDAGPGSYHNADDDDDVNDDDDDVDVEREIFSKSEGE